jgi:hypothetical protein
MSRAGYSTPQGVDHLKGTNVRFPEQAIDPISVETARCDFAGLS